MKNKEFHPNFLSIFYHSSFLARSALLRGITKHAREMHGRMLDFGSGSKPYRDLFVVDEYIGLDMQGSGHNHARSDVDVYYDGKHIPFDNEHFDSVFSSEVFEHVFNLPDILKELQRVTKAGGTLLITIPFAIHEHEVPFDFARYTSFGIRDLLLRAGFEVVSIERTTHYIEAVFQLLVWYNASVIYPKARWLTFLQLLLVVAPFNMLGWVAARVLPKRETFFNNLVVVARRL